MIYSRHAPCPFRGNPFFSELSSPSPLKAPPRADSESQFPNGQQHEVFSLPAASENTLYATMPVFYADPSPATTGNDDNTFGVADGARGSSVDH